MSQSIQAVGAGPVWGWRLVAFTAAAFVCLPLVSTLWLATSSTGEFWTHLWSTVLPRYVVTTLELMAGTGILTALFGLVSAWLVVCFDFPGRRFFSWALLLPFAFPAYVIAFVYTDFLEYAGVLQSALRELFGWDSPGDYWFPEIRSLGGATAMFSLVLYPYVYLTTRAALLEQSGNLFLASRSLGRGYLGTLWSVLLPAVRPGLAVGLALVLMETLNDFGTVDYFAVQTLTAGLFDTWLNYGDVGGAAQIAISMVTFALLLIYLEQFSRRKVRVYQSRTRSPIQRARLNTVQSAWAILFCSALVILGFGLPATILVVYAVQYAQESWTSDFFRFAGNSIMLSSVSAAMLVVSGLLLAYAQRLSRDKISMTLNKMATVGYAMPGAVLAIGVIIPLAAFDNWFSDLSERYWGWHTGLLLSGTAFAILYAYNSRFMAVAVGSAESGLNRITPSMDFAARTLGYRPGAILRKVHLPMLSKSLFTAALIVFVDCMKELPATLILRPFDFETLATYVYQFASDEQLEQSAMAALIIVLTGLLPVILLNRATLRQS